MNINAPFVDTARSRITNWSNIEVKDSGKLIVHARVLVVESLKAARLVSQFAEAYCPGIRWLVEE